MTEEKDKKKKKGKKLLMVNYECLDEDEILKTLVDIKTRLKVAFKTHIGEEDAISPVELFSEVFGVNPHFLDVFKRTYWWNVLKTILRNMRSNEELFVINKRTRLFVLKTEEEAKAFKHRIDSDITALEKTKVKADEWVSKKKWRNL